MVVVALLAGLIGNVYGVIALALVLLAALWLRLSRPTAASPSARPQSAGFDRLVALCYDDREMAERLVAGEERRLSGGARPILVKRAIERLIADRRR